MLMKMKNNKAQVTIFIIIAIIIVVGVGLFFAVRGGLFDMGIPAEMEPVYSYYLDCIESEGLEGIYILGQQAGYIEPPEFSPGSEYMPFSSELSFLGIGVPYWYYVSGNGIVKEQVPSRDKMESQMGNRWGRIRA